MDYILKTTKKNTVIPENTPIIALEMIKKTAIDMAKRRTDMKNSPVKGVNDIECPSCGNNTMSYADDLLFDITLAGKRIIIPNLTGLKCSKCSEAAFDAHSTKIIENRTL